MSWAYFPFRLYTTFGSFFVVLGKYPESFDGYFFSTGGAIGKYPESFDGYFFSDDSSLGTYDVAV